MDYRSPLQQLLHNLLHTRGRTQSAPADTDFVDTEPLDERAAAVQAARRPAPPQRRRALWAESALDLEKGSDVTELPGDVAADLMDEYFSKSHKKAA
jgi:hypothetical protein